MTLPFSQDGFLEHWLRFLPQLPGPGRSGDTAASATGLVSMIGFAPNPGQLDMRAVLPDNLPAGAPLVVLLHGCRQTAEEYLRGSGWGELAARYGFALLLPEQRRFNNANLCFNWFEGEDIARGSGEAASIAAMIHHLLDRAHLDPKRVYVSGLSAGGAMANVLLAAYPELFAGGAIIAGLPFGSATSAQEAFAVMGQGRQRSPAELGARVRAASGYSGPRAPLSIWQGEADPAVNPVNADELIKQWADVLGVDLKAGETAPLDGAERQIWRDATGRPMLTLYRIPDFGHGLPIDPAARQPEARIGTADASPFIMPAGISSTWHIAEGWGLLGAPPAGAASAGKARPAAEDGMWRTPLTDPPPDRIQSAAASWETTIGRLFRSTGLTWPGQPKDRGDRG